jgi:hypothetical protein
VGLLRASVIDSRAMATQKQQKFAKLVACGMNDGQPITILDSYSKAGYQVLGSRKATQVEACRLLASDTVQSLVEQERELLRKSEEKVRKSQEILVISDSERVLDKLRKWIEGEDATTSQLRSAELLGKAASLFQNNLNIETKQRSSAEIESLLQAKLASLALSSGSVGSDFEADTDTGEIEIEDIPYAGEPVH